MKSNSYKSSKYIKFEEEDFNDYINYFSDSSSNSSNFNNEEDFFYESNSNESIFNDFFEFENSYNSEEDIHENHFVAESHLNLNEPFIEDELDKYDELLPLPNKFSDILNYQKNMRTAVLIEMNNEIKEKSNLTKIYTHLEFSISSFIDDDYIETNIWTLKLPVASKSVNQNKDERNKGRINISDSISIEWDKKYNEKAKLPLDFNKVIGKVKSIRGNILIVLFKLKYDKYFPDSRLSPIQEIIPYKISFGPDLTIVTRKINAIESIKNFPIGLQNLILGKKYINENKNNNIELNLDLNLIKLNETQEKIIKRSLTNQITLVQGPPGCGKTYIIAAIVQQIILQKNYKRILVVGPSNVSVENLVNAIKRLIEPLNKIIVWSGSSKTDFKSIKKINEAKKSLSLAHLLQRNTYEAKKFSKLYQLDIENSISFEESIKMKKLKTKCEQNILKEADVVCSTIVSSGKKIINQLDFDYVIIDEATQSFEPETLIPLSHNVKQFILVGDQNQLGPNTYIDKNLMDTNYDRSLFERLLINYKNTDLFTFLNLQYRMHPQICEFSNQKFYNSEIKNGIKSKDRIGILDPVTFINVKGKEERIFTSYQNELESEKVLEIYKLLKINNIEDKKIGIISPYSGQTKLIRKKILGLNKIPDLKIASVDSFQGNERDYIIVSLSRTNNKNLSNFFLDKRRINVTLTRARYCLIIIGNSDLLYRANNIWSDYINFSRKKKYLKQEIISNNNNNNNKLEKLIQPKEEIIPLFINDDKGFEIKEINNTITNSKCRIIWPTDKNDLKYLEEWKLKLLKKLNLKKQVNLSFNTENICIQFGEIFNDSFDYFNDEKIPNINECEGIIIFIYDRLGNLLIEPIKKILEPLINDLRITLYTFDFIKDISKLFKFGFSPKLNKIIDIQTFKIPLNEKNIISNLNIKSIKELIILSKDDLDPFILNAKDWIEKDCNDYPFDVNEFLIDYKKLSITSIVTEDFLIYLSNNIPLIALSSKFIFYNNSFKNNCIKNSMKKVSEFLQIGYKIVNEIRQAEILRIEKSYFMYCSIIEQISTKDLLDLWKNHKNLINLLSLNIKEIFNIFKLNDSNIKTFIEQKIKIENILIKRLNDLLKVRKLSSPSLK